ncbi:ELWxxDGT repeat protein [Chryseobacterium sp. SLBN-27]|uniref:T9SS type A sorting domain-containing protein n=1 Tax=Chryseobacterium sp. SLBN-27 TaxID=3042287 RepID=UPI002864757F|nr:T9SS type A sorting domain-containing protein [Chryseobacterium sp. SLBN-27]MDR6159238.1 ELWxxDGT repeat protein [Chryseobacterium sp. SLBN-27]
MKKKIMTFAIFLIGILIIKSQTPINAILKETNFFPGSEPSGLLQIGNDLIFAANTGSGNEPHKYNLQTGTGGIIQNINGSFSNSMIKNEFYKLNNKAYYFASDNSNLQLWSTDLSTNVTSKIKDFNYFSSSNNIIAKVLNNKLYFVFQQKLYISDGTTAGTFEMTGINNVGNSLQESNGNVFFFGSNSIYGKELWKTDGTIAGTTIVKDINPGSNSSIINEKMYKFNNKIIFTATANNFNLELWSTDGTNSNTVSFYPLNNGYPTFYDYDVESYNGMLFTINGNLWKTDGTFSGTSLIYNNIPNINKLTYFKNKTYINTNTNIYYVDQTNQVSILNNPSGTILQAIASSSNGNYLALREYNNDTSKIYFFDDTNLFQSDIKFTADSKFIEYQNKLLFSGYLDSYVDYYTTYKNTELFSYNPSSNISKIEKDMSFGYHGTPRYYTELNGEVFFVARDGYYFQVYKIDINNNLVKLSNDSQESFPDNFGDYYPVAVSGNYIYFHSNKLIRTDVTANSTQQISPPANEKIYGTYSLNNDKILIKTFNSTDNYMRIWSLSNNATSFALLVEKPVSNFSGSILNVDNDFVKTDSGIYFKIINNSMTEIWKSNGTVANTFKITDLYNLYAFNSFLGSLNNKVFFSDNQNFSYNNTKLYYIDEATNQINFIKDSYYNIDGKSFVKNNQLFFFSGTSNGFITALNSTDGTPQNTQAITQINSEGAYAVKKCGDFGYFLDYHRQKLFRTDGTASGSILVTTGAQNYSELNCMNNEIYGLNSMQKIFKTNGNSGNYQELSFKINNQVLQPGNYLWMKSLFTRNSKIYFSIDQYQDHGEELVITDQINTLATNEESINSTDKIVVYPNPATDYVNIKVSNHERVIKAIIFDINGRLISIHNSSSINIQQLPAGIYFLNIITDLKKYNSKLIKK